MEPAPALKASPACVTRTCIRRVTLLIKFVCGNTVHDNATEKKTHAGVEEEDEEEGGEDGGGDGMQI